MVEVDQGAITTLQSRVGELKDDWEPVQLTEHDLILATKMGLCTNLHPDLVPNGYFALFFYFCTYIPFTNINYLSLYPTSSIVSPG